MVDINILITLKQSGNYEQTSQQLKGITENNTHVELIKNTTNKTNNVIQLPNPMDTYPELDTTMAQLQSEQNDIPLSKVKNTKTDGIAFDKNLYLTGDLQKYNKQLPRLLIGNGSLKRRYYNHDGTTLYNHLSVPNTC